jgi:hypothetical protein
MEVRTVSCFVLPQAVYHNFSTMSMGFFIKIPTVFFSVFFSFPTKRGIAFFLSFVYNNNNKTKTFRQGGITNG